MTANISFQHFPAMPPPGRMYSVQQINIPPELPDILKKFTKAAIRTQPQDVLQWSASYFNNLSKGEALPVKQRLEMPVATQKTDSGLTPGLLKDLHKQLANKKTTSKEELQERWQGLCLPLEQLDTLLVLGNFSDHIDWMHFLALGCSALAESITSAMKYACEILTENEEDGVARIQFDTFVGLYTYLAHIDGEIPQEQIDSFLSRLQETATRQNNMIQVDNFYNLMK
ncbi:hypothetical protein UPYG_G00074520 [Umbra pygmaea]|uniref:Ropporin-1-like protein n=1 Tax=Umbra pygmaea TaxID=75934 RepID=A0ABD0XFY8_UMBPY